MGQPPLFYAITGGIRITVRPRYLDDHSRRDLGQFVFLYAVRIENVGAHSVQLLRRRWHIHDDIGEDTEVAGDGVVGEQPVLAPGGVHEYQSYCILKSASGYMEGEYYLVQEDGSELVAAVPRFTLEAEARTDLH